MCGDDFVSGDEGAAKNSVLLIDCEQLYDRIVFAWVSVAPL